MIFKVVAKFSQLLLRQGECGSSGGQAVIEDTAISLQGVINIPDTAIPDVVVPVMEYIPAIVITKTLVRSTSQAFSTCCTLTFRTIHRDTNSGLTMCKISDSDEKIRLQTFIF